MGTEQVIRSVCITTKYHIISVTTVKGIHVLWRGTQQSPDVLQQ